MQAEFIKIPLDVNFTSFDSNHSLSFFVGELFTVAILPHQTSYSLLTYQ